jgi:site-specific DNA-methyltransferase (adenine-specific)
MKLYHGDCLEVMSEIADNSVDSIVTDPPYGLSFMGKKWDYDVPSQEIWEECLRVLKPGGYLLSFAGTRTQHRMACRIEDAGFEIRDMIAWVYGSGFPKSLNISKAIDKMAGAEREVVGKVFRGDVEKAKTSGVTMAAADANKNNKAIFGYGTEDITSPATDEAKQWDGWGTALKPAIEPITVARKPLSEKTVAANVLKHGCGGINIDASRVDAIGVDLGRNNNARKQDDGSSYVVQKKAMRIDNSGDKGRWPANFIHDGSEEVLALFPESSSSKGKPRQSATNGQFFNTQQVNSEYSDKGSAARFFYCAKASKKDRNEGCETLEPKQYSHDGRETPIDNAYQRNSSSGNNSHPTVKPTDLMKYLCRLVTPPGGIVLDPFMGSGSTGKAAIVEGFDFIGIEKDEHYFIIALNRIYSL